MVKVVGQKALRGNFNRLKRFNVNSLSPVIRQSLEPMRDEWKNNARKLRQPGRRPKGGHLDQGVVTRKVKATGRFQTEWWVTLTRRARSIGHLVEYGTRPHDQPIRRIYHPGATPKPFARPAEASKRDDVERSFIGLSWQVIQASIIPQ